MVVKWKFWYVVKNFKKFRVKDFYPDHFKGQYSTKVHFLSFSCIKAIVIFYQNGFHVMSKVIGCVKLEKIEQKAVWIILSTSKYLSSVVAKTSGCKIWMSSHLYISKMAYYGLKLPIFCPPTFLLLWVNTLRLILREISGGGVAKNSLPSRLRCKIKRQGQKG